jgi:vacuolar protein sorting-associated protein 13A/C
MYEGTIEAEGVESMTTVFLESSFTLSIGIPSQEGDTSKVAWSKPISFAKGADEDLHFFKVNPVPSRKGSLRINARFKNYKGTFRLEFFNQVWVANQTGIPLYMIQSHASTMFAKPTPISLPSSATDSVSFASCPPTMVSFPKLDPARNKVGIAVSSSQRISTPSEQFSLSAIGYRGVAVVNQCAPEDTVEENNRAYHIGVSIDLASNKRTKLVKLTPRYVIVNDGSKPMLVGQPGTNNILRIGAGERVPLLYWIHSANCLQILRMSLDADDTPEAAWSAAFDIKTVGELTLKMERPITIQGYSSLNYIKVHKVLCDSTIYVIFSPSAKAPYYIDNQTDMTLNINQQGIGIVERIPPKSMIPYTWDKPLHEHKLEVTVEGTRFKAVYRLDKLKVYPTRTVECGEVVVDVAASIVPEEASRILRLANFNRHPPHAPTEEVVNQQFRVNLRAVGVSVISEINHSPHEILYASLEDIYASFSNSDLFQKLEVKLGNLQVDNQLATVKNYLYPVLLSSIKDDPAQPFFHLSFVNSNTVSSRSTTHVHYLSALLQEMDIKLEERLIYRLMDFANILGFSDKREHPTLNDEGSLHDEKQFESATVHLDIEELRKQSDNRMYLELLVINPLKVNFTFQVSHMGLGKKEKETPLLEFCRNLGFTLINCYEAPLRLNALTLRHAFGSMTDIQQPLQKHYMQQGLREAYKVIGSFDVLGNPVNLLRDLGTGFRDFFVEPSRGITHSPEEFRAGIAKGSTSLMKHTVYALANTATSLTETTARGFAAMSMDKDYLTERDRILREPPANFGQGVVQGAKGLGAGVKYGVSGIVMLPIQGAKQEGAVGLAKGIPKGLAGAVLKPTAGAADLVALSSQSVRNMADPAPKLERKRTPRHFPCDGALAEYNAEKAYGGYLMQALFKHESRPTSGSSTPSKSEMDYLTPAGESSSSNKIVTVTSSPFHALDESYVFHIIWRNSTTLLFTNRRLVCFADPRAIRKRWDVLLAST